TRPACALSEWWSERRCAREWGELVRPDAYAVWVEAGASLPFLYEHDNGTERLRRLARKLDGYARLAAEAGHPNWVLFTFAGPRREADARRVLAHPTVPVATAARTPSLAPDRAVWLPVTGTGPRLRLVDLAGLPISEGAGDP
ncbi:MAG: replication-relaxation family protein, partial [Acidimicrobiales bacterium]